MEIHEEQVWMLLSVAACGGYTHQAIQYCGKLLECKNAGKWMTYTMPFLMSLIFFLFTAENAVIPVVYGLTFFLMIFIMTIMYRGTMLQIVFASGNFVFHLLAIKGIILSTISLIMGINMYKIVETDLLYRISLFLTFLVSAIFLKLFRTLYVDQKIELLIQNASQMRLLVVAQFTLNLLLLLSSFSYYYNLDLVWFALYHLMSCSLVLVTFYIILDYSANTGIMIEMQIKSAVRETQIKIQLDHYHADMRKRLTKSAECNKEFSNHSLLQFIFMEAQDLCQEKEIDFEADMFLENQINLNEFEICSVFFELLMNAIEACDYLEPSKKKFICVKGYPIENWLTVCISNSFDGKIMVKDGVMISRKTNRKNYGFGLDRIRKIIYTKNGLIKFQANTQSGIFTSTLNLPYHYISKGDL